MQKQARQYAQKFAMSMAKAPIREAPLAKIAAPIKPKRRPFLLMIKEAGTVPLAMPTTIDATGIVASAGDGVNSEPMMPPRKMVTLALVNANT